jgi:hypothetical protein
MSAFDVEYYRRRLGEERKQAAAAADAKIAALHEELATLYEKMIEALEGPTTEAA